jgi:hypothetical protein
VSYRTVTTKVATDVDTNVVNRELDTENKRCDVITSCKVGIEVIVFMKKIRPTDVENAEKSIKPTIAITGINP